MLVTVQGLTKSYGTELLFEDVTFGIHESSRIGLIGPNGAGKSTTLKIIYGSEWQDAGSIVRRQNLALGYCSQSPEFPSMPIFDLLMQEACEMCEYERAVRASILLSKAEFTDTSKMASQLSGGWKKRLDIVRAMMNDPDLLLLDEPTNHLDLEGILWLERFLQKESLSFVMVSHDRYFLNAVCTSIIELNRCYEQGVFSAQGSLDDFFLQKERFLEAERQRERGLAHNAKEELDWLKRSPKARTTKSRSRIRDAHELFDELSKLKMRNSEKKISLSFAATERETRKLLVGKNLTKSAGEKFLFKGIDITLSPGTRLGLVGKNGTGKTTFLRLLAGEIAPDMGTIKRADGVKICYFDQHRQTIPQKVTLQEALSPNGDYVEFQGQPIHVRGWAKKFLFAPERLTLPVECLSGGERARILIAKLLLQPADILLLDEPTNDLDIQTLEVIEESLCEFPGAVVLISHDRCLMDRICTSILGFGIGFGIESEMSYFADYAQWQKVYDHSQKRSKEEKEEKVQRAPPPSVKTGKKLSYKEQKELAGMEGAIEAQEAEVKRLQAVVEQGNGDRELYAHLGAAQAKLESLFERWQFLDSSGL
jgi:ATP-binding cassette subfamily F protein uup